MLLSIAMNLGTLKLPSDPGLLLGLDLVLGLDLRLVPVLDLHLSLDLLLPQVHHPQSHPSQVLQRIVLDRNPHSAEFIPLATNIPM